MWRINKAFPAGKGILIILLALLSIYQTGVLWFGNIANRNFLQNHFPFLQQPTIPEELGLLITPYRIVTGHGNNNFSIQYNGLWEAESKRYGDMVLLNLLQNGIFVSIKPADFVELLQEPAYIFEYAFPMEAEWFTLGFGLRDSNLMSRNVGAFRQIIIRPPTFCRVTIHEAGIGIETEIKTEIKTGIRTGAEIETEVEAEMRAGIVTIVESELELTRTEPEDRMHIFGVEGNSIESNGVESEEQSNSQNVSVFFISDSGYAIEFTVPPPNSDEPDFFAHCIPTAPTKGNRFVSTALSGINAPPSLFVGYGSFQFNGVRHSLPYAGVYNEFMIASLRNQLRTFFNNQIPSHEEPDADVWVFRDMQHTVVRYHNTHLLEYRNFHAINRSAPVRFVDNFAAAIQFLERDDLIINEFYLASFREDERSESRHVFYFNYVIADMPLVMCGEWPENSGLIYPIEVTVDHGTVVSFKKLAFNFHIEENVTFIGEMDEILQQMVFENIRMGYLLASNEIFVLYWCLDSTLVRVPTVRVDNFYDEPYYEYESYRYTNLYQYET